MPRIDRSRKGGVAGAGVPSPRFFRPAAFALGLRRAKEGRPAPNAAGDRIGRPQSTVQFERAMLYTDRVSWYRTTPEGVVLTLRVVPRAAKDAVQGVLGDALKVRLQAPPVEGKANAALVRFLAERLDLPRSSVQLLSGSTGRAKQVLVVGLAASDLRSRLGV